MRRVFVASVMFVIGCGVYALLSATPVEAAKGSCANVRCASCPDGYHLLMKWPNCCACVAN